jgi:hypothetical protein
MRRMFGRAAVALWRLAYHNACGKPEPIKIGMIVDLSGPGEEIAGASVAARRACHVNGGSHLHDP